MKTVIVIPTYNEKNNLRPLVEEIFNVAPDTNILVVDDNSALSSMPAAVASPKNQKE